MRVLFTRRQGHPILLAPSSEGTWWAWLTESTVSHGPAPLSAAVTAAVRHADRLPHTNHPATPWLAQIAAQGR